MSISYENLKWSVRRGRGRGNRGKSYIETFGPYERFELRWTVRRELSETTVECRIVLFDTWSKKVLRVMPREIVAKEVIESFKETANISELKEAIIQQD